MQVIVVESPTKAKHIRHILGAGNEVIPTLGHILELPSKALGLDYANEYEPQYTLIRGKGEILARIKAAGEQAERIILATDPDREGEGIALHIYEQLPVKLRKKCIRAEFMSITKQGILDGLNQLKPIDMNKAEAQKARRIMDRMAGYEVSPMLWQRIKGKQGLSAGRVQSAALKLIADRHRAISAFQSADYWTFEGTFTQQDITISAALIEYGGQLLSESTISSRAKAAKIGDSLAESSYTLAETEIEMKRYKAPDPFITTTLLRAAYSELGLNAQQTMKAAQALFENGYITYMRTDSRRVATDARQLAKQVIIDQWGPQYARDEETQQSVEEHVQDAHECIRPADPLQRPQELSLGEEHSLYSLIYWRFIQSQMAAAIHREWTGRIHGQGSVSSVFSAFSSSLVFDGWRVLGESNLPFQEGAESLKKLSVRLRSLEAKEHQTKAPSRYTEASLIEALEKSGIGRPSTYATILQSLRSRSYIEEKKNSIHITSTGLLVVETLEDCFPTILSLSFTAQMEADLDQVAAGVTEWLPVVKKLHHEIERKGSERKH